MRTFRIDYTNTENKLPDGDIVGKFGEHNATLLKITPPQEMTECADIAYYRIAFGLTNYRTIHSGTLEKSETVSLALFAQVTRSDTISVQLVGYGADDSLVMKSETVKKLKFSESVGGTEISADGDSHNLGAEVAAMQTKLNKFGEDEKGNLIYNGNPISSSSAIKTVSIDINGFSDTGIDNGYWISAGENAFLLLIDGDLLPENAEIVEMKMQLLNENQIRSKADLYSSYYISTGTVLDVFARGQKISSPVGYFENETVVAYLGDPFSMSLIIEEVSSQNPMHAVIYYKEG